MDMFTDSGPVAIFAGKLGSWIFHEALSPFGVTTLAIQRGFLRQYCNAILLFKLFLGKLAV